VWTGRCGFAVQEFARRHGDFAIAGAVMAVALDDDGRVSRCAIGLLGLGSTPRRAFQAEAAIIGRAAPDVDADVLGDLAMAGLEDIPADLQGSASYRRKVGAAMVSRAWAEAIAQAGREAINA
jgi:carbon-monoxide dehydrogenase medium subunit